jgi:sugar (pentulose or hexulose) kinase
VVVCSLGTSGTVFTWSATPVVDPAGLIAPFCSSDGGWLPLLCVMNLTGVTEEVKAAFGADHGALTEAASRVVAGCDGLLWMPFLQGERVPDLPTATGTLLGMRPGLLRAGHLYRAALEGTSLNLGWGVDRLRGLGIGVGEVRLVGGAARNELWRKILAAVLGARVVPLAEPESGALGAALQALWTDRRRSDPRADLTELAAPFVQLAPGAVDPDPALVATYRDLSVRYAREVERLSAVQG